MSNQDTPREIKILADNLCKLQAFAWQAVYYRNLGLGEFVLFSVEANSRWSNLADFLLKQLDEVFPVDNYDDLVINGFATPALLEVTSSCMPTSEMKFLEAQPPVLQNFVYLRMMV